SIPDFTLTNPPASGSGTSASPYLINDSTVYTFSVVDSTDGDVSTDATTNYTVNGAGAGTMGPGDNTLDVTNGFTGDFNVSASYKGNPTAPSAIFFHVDFVDLGIATPFGSFGGGSGMTNQGIFTVVNGDIGTTGASTMITGFHDSDGDVYSETPLNVGQVNGQIYSAPPAPGTAEQLAIATQASNDAQTAYNNISPASLPGGTDPGAGQLGGLTLIPGVYKAAGGSFTLTGSNLTLDAQGDPNAVWVFQCASSLTVGDTQPRSVILVNGAQPRNVYWYVGSAATINGAGGGTMVGTIIASAGVTFSTAGNVILTTLDGRAIGLNASVTLVNTIINVP
ncbi:MAG: ice-binding family protein, partial [bacterium]|nr:ice-binding family protein [bacterium]